MTQFHAGTRGADESQGPGATSSGSVSAFLRCDTTGPPASFLSRSVHGVISRPANLKRVLLVARCSFPRSISLARGAQGPGLQRETEAGYSSSPA